MRARQLLPLWTQGGPRMERKRPNRVERTSAFRLQLIRSPGFHRPIMRVATSGDRRRPFKHAPVKLARPVCKTVPADLRKIPTQCGDIGVVADAVEPLEHERRILALLASRGDWDFLIVDRATAGVREDFRLLLAGYLVPGEIEPLAEHLLAPLNQSRDEGPDVRQGYKLEDAFGRHREGVRPLAGILGRSTRAPTLVTLGLTNVLFEEPAGGDHAAGRATEATRLEP